MRIAFELPLFQEIQKRLIKICLRTSYGSKLIGEYVAISLFLSSTSLGFASFCRRGLEIGLTFTSRNH